MKDSRTLVYKTLEGKGPERPPRHVWDVPWTYETYPNEIAELKARYPEDITWCPPMLKEDPGCIGDKYKIGTYIDEWGCEFNNLFEGIHGEIKMAQITSDEWEEVDQIKVPTAYTNLDVEAINQFCAETDQFVVAATTVRLFERLQFLAGTPKVLMDLYEDPEAMEPAIEMVHECFCRELEAWGKTDVDALFIQDDWGTQLNLLISPALWREIFKPRYAEYAAIARKYNKKIFMHSDGNILHIIPDLIEIGIDALNSQIFCIGLENLAQFKGKITFWGEIDRQGILPFGTTEDVKKAVNTIKDLLWNNGGVIAQCDFGIGVKPENVLAVFETWEELFG